MSGRAEFPHALRRLECPLPGIRLEASFLLEAQRLPHFVGTAPDTDDEEENLPGAMQDHKPQLVAEVQPPGGRFGAEEPARLFPDFRCDSQEGCPASVRCAVRRAAVGPVALLPPSRMHQREQTAPPGRGRGGVAAAAMWLSPSSLTAVATNSPFAEWDKIFADPRLCAAIADRITFRCTLIQTGNRVLPLPGHRVRTPGRAGAVTQSISEPDVSGYWQVVTPCCRQRPDIGDRRRSGHDLVNPSYGQSCRPAERET